MSAFDSFMSKLFPPRTTPAGNPLPEEANTPNAADPQDLGAAAAAPLLTDEQGRPLSLPRGKPISEAQLRKQYQRAPSFASRLPWVEYLPESGCFLLEDGVSVGVVAEVIPIPTEGRSGNALEALRDQIEAALQDSLPENDDYQWVAQLYCRDETDPREDLEALADYARPEIRDSQYTQDWLKSMEGHLRAIAKPGGLFIDDVVTQVAWRGQTRRTRLVLYRWERTYKGKQQGRIGERNKGLPPEQAVNYVFDRLETALQNAELRLKRYDAREFHRWMMPRFNPRPRYAPDDPQRFYDVFDYPGDDQAALMGYDLAEGMLASSPRGDVETGYWYFDGMPHTCVPVEELRQAPKVGHVTGEVARGDGRIRNALMDQLPEGTEMCLTMVTVPQDPLEQHIDTLKDKAHGNSIASEKIREDCKKARSFLGDNHKMYQASLVFFINGRDESDLEDRLMRLTTQLTNANLKPTEPEDEIAGLNTYLRWLPMAFQPELDRKNRWYTQYHFVQHLANLSPLFGRARGTGHPGITFFNRGGGTVSFDPLNSDDRQANAHMLFFGPTGAGKSATLNSVLAQMMALHRPRTFIIEKGNSFGLLADYFERMGLTVNKVKLAPGSGVRLSPFFEAHRLLETEEEAKRVERDRNDQQEGLATDPDTLVNNAEEEEERNILGEMEITARLMITGGDPKEEALFRRADQRMVRDAIYRGARYAVDAGRQCLTEDVRQGFRDIANDTETPEEGRRRAYQMGEAMGLFVDGFDGQVFNRPGEPWPECDVTIIDLAHYANEGYEAQLALSVISITNVITAMAERDQYSGRPILQAIDECHILTTNPLLAPFLVGVGKMGRKLNHWLWLATQNLEDFPESAAKLLNMIEWWILLTMPEDEIKQVTRFKSLSEDQQQLVKSATKVKAKYTEGVVLGGRIESLFRVVPPSLYLSLAGTEGEEKAERRQVMNELKCSELDAGIEIARRMDEKRGIGG